MPLNQPKKDRLLDSGAMGSVYLAHDRSGKSYALKLLHQDAAAQRTLFEQEVEILSKLKHPALVTIQGFSKTEGKMCFWMDYIEGRPLLEAAKSAKTEEVLKWFQEGLDALEYLHAQEVLHGDLKPSNLMVQKDSHVKLVDFGLAMLRQRHRQIPGKVQGSIPYLAPEALEGEYLPSSDLFSLGTLFYQALTGRHPRAQARDLKSLFALKVTPIRELNPEVPSSTARVIERLIEPKLGNRLKTARDTKEALLETDLKVETQTYDAYSFQRFGMEECWEKFFAFKKQLEQKQERGIALIHGWTGVGKSRLVRELFFEMALQGDTVVQHRANPQEKFLSKDFKTPFAIQIISEAQALSPTQLRDLYHFLHTASSEAWAGLLVLEYNDESLSPFHQTFFSSLGLEAQVLDLSLQNLNRTDAKALLQALLNTELAESIFEELYSRTQGNPKLLTELCREISNAQILTQKRLTPALFETIALPKTTQELFTQRVRKLNHTEHAILSYLAVALGPTSIKALLALTQEPFKAVRQALLKLVQVGLLKHNETSEVETYQMAHPSLGQWVAAQLSPEKKIKLHQRWLTCLKENFDILTMAHHAVEIPHHPNQSQWVEQAGKILQKQEDHDRALKLYEKCLEQTQKTKDREWLLRAIINCYGQLERFQDAQNILEQWYSEYAKHGDPELNAVKYWFSSAVNFQNLGNLPEARKRLESCIQVGNKKKDQRPFISRAYSLLGLSDLQEENFFSAQENFKKALELLPDKSIQRAEVFQYQARLAAHQGQWQQALFSLKAAENLYQELKHPAGIFSVALERGNLAFHLGKIENAEAAYTQALSQAKENKEDASLARVYQNRGVVHCRTGHYAQAIEDLEKAREVFTFLGNPMERNANLMQLALAYAAVGRFAKSETMLTLPRQGVRKSQKKRLQEVEFQITLMQTGRIPKAMANPFSDNAVKPAFPWDLEQTWLQEMLTADQQPKDLVRRSETRRRIGKILTEIYQKLPDALKISFEERGDYQRWVLEEETKHSLSLEGRGEYESSEATMDILQKVSEITKELLSATDVNKVLIRLMDAAMDFSKAKHGFLILRSQTSTGPLPGFEIKVARNMAQEEIESEDFRLSLSVLQKALETGKPLVTDNALLDQRFERAQSVHQMELKSILALPLKGSGGPIGALYLDHPYQTDIFQEADLNILQMLADQAALALQKAEMIGELQKSNLQLTETVADQASEISVLKREVEDHRGQLKHEYQDIIGQSPAMLEMLSMVDRITETKVPVWIFGESGTGKEMIAKALHFNSSRAPKPFVTENCSALPETLLESELFGHKKGAFTHADRDKKGLLEYAHGGTVFLDEIADMSPAMQAKLLRFLQEGEIRPLGSNQIVQVDVRVVSASNKNLQQLVEQDQFREDLYYRLNGVTLTLPPLRERMEDIALLTQHFLKKIAEEEKKEVVKITAEALEQLMEYPWPGNVRELENTLRTATLFQQKGKITLKSFNFKFSPKHSWEKRSGTNLSNAPQKSIPSQEAQLSEEKKLLLQALHEAGFHKGHAAQALGISRRYLYTQMLKHHVPTNRIELKSYIQEHLGI